MLREIDRSKAAFANLLPTPEIANDLIWFLFWILRRRWATAHSGRRRSWSRHGVCLALSIPLLSLSGTSSFVDGP